MSDNDYTRHVIEFLRTAHDTLKYDPPATVHDVFKARVYISAAIDLLSIDPAIDDTDHGPAGADPASGYYDVCGSPGAERSASVECEPDAEGSADDGDVRRPVAGDGEYVGPTVAGRPWATRVWRLPGDLRPAPIPRGLDT